MLVAQPIGAAGHRVIEHVGQNEPPFRVGIGDLDRDAGALRSGGRFHGAQDRADIAAAREDWFENQPDLEPELWQGDDLTESLFQAGKRLDALGLLPAPFPLHEIVPVCAERDTTAVTHAAAARNAKVFVLMAAQYSSHSIGS